jgi:hypothetical protein
MLRRLTDGLAQAPKKGAASCDKLRVGACSLRSGDPRMGLPITIPSGIVMLREEREPPELKHLSRGRKRDQMAFP